jgi:hypothetical protein
LASRLHQVAQANERSTTQCLTITGLGTVKVFAALREFWEKMQGPPRPCKGRVRSDDAVCLNVSGLSRVGRCCGQAMMNLHMSFPDKWFGQEARFLHRVSDMPINHFIITFPNLAV